MADLTYYDVLEAIKDVLNDNLDDPYVSAGGSRTSASWVLIEDEPQPNYKFPIVQIKKIASPSEIISLGWNFWEWNHMILNIYFWTKEGFTYSVGSKNLKDKKLVEYYLSHIKKTLKNNQEILFDNGISGYKTIDTSEAVFVPEIKCYVGFIQIRVWWFEQ